MSKHIDRGSIENRRALLPDGSDKSIPVSLTESQVKNKLENYVGCIPYPVGLIGPISIDGKNAHGEYIIPMATIEGTIVASYSRGCRVMNESAKQLGRSAGCEALCYDSYISRMINFTCDNLKSLSKLMSWCADNEATLISVAESTSNHVKVIQIDYVPMGCTLGIKFSMWTGDAMGSNMGANAVMYVSSHITKNCGLSIQPMPLPFPEDKKNTPLFRKGHKVICSTIITKEVLQKMCRTTPNAIHEWYTYSSAMLGLHGGSSMNVYALNGMAAFYLAFGQDIAYLGECSQSITVLTKITDQGHLDISLTIPSMIIGTIGGGTGLPAFKSLLKLVDCEGQNTCDKLAEIICAGILAGEISCVAAQCSNEFVESHQTMGKNTPRGGATHTPLTDITSSAGIN